MKFEVIFEIINFVRMFSIEKNRNDWQNSSFNYSYVFDDSPANLSLNFQQPEQFSTF